ncbi:uncharacterized protein QC761_0013280 [Podospora bellae-mahoneyi]|uniref:Uncharacterized protein n=1 Tax=Podospora bellae-mahoneyi TaxID=2093777 RepID=A0ABR0FYV2_9PEZI|nr:hypothetical protein QC761_0013280 [Podospora bellae-mahoneyi]
MLPLSTRNISSWLTAYPEPETSSGLKTVGLQEDRTGDRQRYHSHAYLQPQAHNYLPSAAKYWPLLALPLADQQAETRICATAETLISSK